MITGRLAISLDDFNESAMNRLSPSPWPNTRATLEVLGKPPIAGQDPSAGIIGLLHPATFPALTFGSPRRWRDRNPANAARRSGFGSGSRHRPPPRTRSAGPARAVLRLSAHQQLMRHPLRLFIPGRQADLALNVVHPIRIRFAFLRAREIFGPFGWRNTFGLWGPVGAAWRLGGRSSSRSVLRRAWEVATDVRGWTRDQHRPYPTGANALGHVWSHHHPGAARLGTLYGLAFGYPLIPAIVIGSLLASHTLISLPIVARLGAVDLEPIVVTIGATVVSDTLSLIIFAICGSTHTTGFSASRLAIQIAEIAIFVPLILIGVSRTGALILNKLWDSEEGYFVTMLGIVAVSGTLGDLISLPGIALVPSWPDYPSMPRWLAIPRRQSWNFLARPSSFQAPLLSLAS